MIFSVLGLSFWATTGLLYWEFAEDWRRPTFEGALWFDLMTHHSHIFLFFPLFGTVALLAFYLPAVVFVDMYWRRAKNPEDEIPGAKFRFCAWFIALAAFSAAGAWGLNLGSETALWQLGPDALKGTGRPGQICAERAREGQCLRVTIPTVLANVRRVSQDREKLVDLKRMCGRDPLIEQLAQPEQRRFCFVTAEYSRDAGKLLPSLLDDAACCRAIDGFERGVRQRYLASPDNRSHLDRVQFATLVLKIFFLLVILVVSILLALRHRRIKRQYADVAHRVDRGVLIGAIAMLFLPFMNHAFMLSTELIYGPNDVMGGISGVSFYRVPHALSIAFGIWAGFILLFFIRRDDKEAERMTKIISAVASGVFVLQYESILNYAVRYAGPEVGNQSLSVLVVIAVAMVLALALLKVFKAGRSVTEQNQPVADHSISDHKPRA